MRWIENPYWQYFCGEVYFQTTAPFHYTSLGKWRLRIGAERLKLLLEETIRIAQEKQFVNEQDLSRVIVDTTVHEKNVTFPTDAKLLSRCLFKLSKFCLHHNDGHTLSRSILGAEAITRVTVMEANVDKGYRGHDYKGGAVVRLSGSSHAGLSVSELRRKRRRSVVESVIGHFGACLLGWIIVWTDVFCGGVRETD